MYCRYCCRTELLAQRVNEMYPFQRGAASEWYVLLSIYFRLSVICWLKSQDCNRWVCTQGARVNSVILSFHQSVRVVDIITFCKQLCSWRIYWGNISLELRFLCIYIFFYVKPRLTEVGGMNPFYFFNTTDWLCNSSNSLGPLILPYFLGFWQAINLAYFIYLLIF